MSQPHCPVAQTLDFLQQALEGNRLQHPRSRRLAGQAAALIADVVSGRAGADHLPAIERLAAELTGFADDPQGPALGQHLHMVLSDHREVFVSHVETQNCASEVCDRLAPAPCQMACPAGIDVPTYVALIAEGRYDEAIDAIRRDNPFPWVCGLVCTRPCEFMCVRGRMDKPVAIKALKAFAAERALSQGRYANPPAARAKNRKVGVIGAGPGGMSAAYYLALKGYSVRVIEALPSAGGMMMVGIPRYRLPREVIDREAGMIEDLGVQFCFNTRLGRDITLAQLKEEGFEAFFVAVGAHDSFKLGIAGENEFAQVLQAIDFLKNVALGERHLPGKRIIIIGGGNVAIDAARTCLRLGAASVTLAYRRTRSEMPADEEEIEQAEEEGVRFDFLTVPVAIQGRDGHLTGLNCLRAELVVKPGSDRKVPVPIEGSDFVMPADAVISAIGQRIDRQDLAELRALSWTRRDTIQVHSATMQTSIPGVFAAGDAVSGPATVVEAIGGGKRAAMAIDRYLSGLPQPNMPPVPTRQRRASWTEVPAATKMALKRPPMPLINIDRRRTTFQQVELGYSENMVREEARRCLRCDICRRCGLCVSICRDKMGVNALQLGYMDFDHPVTSDFRATQERCILCGACAANCPNDAMQMEDRKGERVLHLCGTVLNRQALLYCEDCGAVIGPARYRDFVTSRTQRIAPTIDDRRLCEKCARRQSAHDHHQTMRLE
ncbi:MAG: 4Fe-4S ferredoxin [Desulfobacteraceae bacterium]|nr:MAG: 4Fe-4S ferredoxin [Desulfobacteraceae bacterium]